MDLHRCGKSVGGKVDVIFVHGLGGEYRDTWTNQQSVFWPETLASHLGTEARVWSLAYEAPVWAVSEGGRLRETLGTDAITFLDLLQQKQIGDRPIVFITHSLGGLFVKAILRRADEARRQSSSRQIEHPIAAMTRAVVFFATPHCGSSLIRLKLLIPLIAKVGTAGLATGLALFVALPKLMLIGLPSLIRWLLRPSQYVEQLGDNDPSLREIADSYRRFAERSAITTVAYYEQKRVLGVSVVSPCSADPGLPQCTPIGMDANHIGISKLTEGSVPFSSVEELVRRVASSAEAGKTRAVFAEALNEEIRDLLHDPKLESLKMEFESASKGDQREIRLPKKFASIPAAKNLRGEFEGALRSRLRKLIQDDVLQLSASEVEMAERSVYDLDKYVLYLWREQNLQHDFKAMRESVDNEILRIKNAVLDDGDPSLIPFYRAVRALEHTIEDDLGGTLRSLQEGQQIIMQQRQLFTRLDDGYETRDLLQRLESSLRDFRKTADSVREEQAKKREDRRKQRGEDVYRAVQGTITVPKSGEMIGTSYACSGTVTGLQPGLSLRLAIEVGGLIWPKEDNVRVDSDQSKWSAELFEQGNDNGQFSLSLYVVNGDASDQIWHWIERSREMGSYQGLTGIPGGRRLAIVDLRRTPREAQSKS